MNASEIRLAIAAWKLLNRKYHLTTARFERVAKKEPLAKVVTLVQSTFGVHISKDADGVYTMKETEAKPKVRAAKKVAKKAAKKVAAKKLADVRQPGTQRVNAPAAPSAGLSHAAAKRR